MTYSIRKATPADRPTLAAMQARIFNVLDHRDVEKDHWWIVEVKGTLVPAAFAVAASAGPSWPQAAFMALAGVLDEHRGRGLQKRLLRVREAWARRQGYTVAITYTAHSNNASSNSLIGSGYKLYKPQQPWGLDYALYWKKNLNAAR